MDARWTALAILTAARTSMGFQFQSVGSVSPLLVADLRLTYADLGTLIGLYFLPGIALALPAGLLARRFGDKRVVVLGLILMVIGGATTGYAGSFAGLALGRVLSGAGAVLLNVTMAKMITDWFAGSCDIVLAMAVFVNSFPIGVGLALLSLGSFAAAAGWAAALLLTALLALASLLLVVLRYQPHPNDNAGGSNTSSATTRISTHEVALVCVAGAIWGIVNGAFSITFGFAPTFLAANGLSLTTVGLVVGLSTWLVVASGYIGGIVAQRWNHPTMLMVASVLAWAACLIAVPLTQAAPALIAAGALMGLPVGVIMALPAQVLRSENRAVGMGFFYLWLYVGHGCMPPLAGWLQDNTGNPAAPLYFAAAAVACILPLYGFFRSNAASESRAQSG
jgi:cyanate permease